jgi:hypothetical protein
MNLAEVAPDVTKLGDHGVSDEIWAEVEKQFEEGARERRPGEKVLDQLTGLKCV